MHEPSSANHELRKKGKIFAFCTVFQKYELELLRTLAASFIGMERRCTFVNDDDDLLWLDSMLYVIYPCRLPWVALLATHMAFHVG